MSDANNYRRGFEDGDQDRLECYDSWVDWGEDAPDLPDKCRPDWFYKRGYRDGVNGIRYLVPTDKRYKREQGQS